MTLEEIEAQPAIYNRSHYNLHKDDEQYMQKKRDAGLRHAQKKRLKEHAQTHNINQEDLTERQITEKMNDKRPPVHSAYEYQMDLLFISDLKEQKFKVGVLMIHVFDKFMHVVPIKSKQEGDVASGMIECLHKMEKSRAEFIQMMKEL